MLQEIDMTSARLLDSSLKRLAAALTNAEAAWRRRAAGERARIDAAETVSILQDDRTRLAVELDGALARLGAMTEANLEIERRLNSAGSALHSVIQALAPDASVGSED
jgi:hypothetical protein